MCRFYSIIHEEPDGGYSAEVPALPGCYTDGDTLDEVKANLREAIQLGAPTFFCKIFPTPP